ncbi:low-density lipoprotein receptor-related protein 1B-like [Macrobrachium rosenbergii]|uniref:low-density lipoprotein receptor-related protein 1B-like n=1 Tax=Macrobrachium rosenbergii TaxID=79674 RepID=UPI0034D421BD
MTGDNAKCEFQCRQDEDCPQLYYCCPNGCGLVCVPPEVTGTDSCGCSVTFLTQSGSYYDYYSTDDDDYSYSYDEFYYAQEAHKEEAILMNFVLATVNESFTPSMEPHVITPEFKWSSLGHYESLCQLQRSMTPFDAGVRYDVFKKPTRKLFIITKKSKTLERISDANLKGTYSVICLLTVGSARPNDALLSQLTKKVDGSPCHWEVERYHDLYGLLPQIKDFISDAEGGVCKVDADCGGHPMICDRGTCRKKNLYQPQTFSPQHDEYLNFFSYFYDYPLEDYSYLKSHAGAFASEYDYFLDGYDDLFQDEEFYKEFDDSLRGKDWLSRGEPTRYHYVDLPVEIKYPENGYCGQDYYQCSGVYTICVSDKRVCDGTPDCPHQDDESDEACAKRNCDEEWFQCKSGECIPKERACNGARDCPDGSDEYCEDSSDCPPFRQHYCQSGECISHFQICDGRPNCKNAEDERGCMCKGFRCSSGECVYHSRRCDGRVDCSDGSDEICTNFTCPEYRPFKCAGGGECIRRKEVCNSVKNCPDGSDERTEVCNPSKCFYCSSGNCIPRASVCNGQDDCDDRSDELNCRNFSCRTGQFHCASGACLPEAVLCNGREECPDGSDEFACSEESCPDSRPLFCSSGECIPSKLACNGFFDCQDRSDESKCPNLPCLTGRGYKCNSGQCLPSYLSNAACDRRKNCKDGSDELNCDNPPCPFKCGSGECIGNKLLCNGFRSCADGSDEENCEGVPCNGNQFRCGSGECLESARRCDGGKDCNDGSDEENCQTYQCPKGSFKCGSGECFPKYKKCDFSPDCRDGSDEEGCQNKARCFGENEIHCKSGECIDKWRICDGYADCSDGSDEAFCSDFQCPFYRPFQCASGECRRAFHRCDGFVSCADASDEDRCGNFTCPDKRPFPCPSGECLTYYQVCNGYEDCSDGSDEKECDSFSCPGTTFQCKAGNCLPLRFVCDKDRDCPDGDDELNCDSGM